MACNSIHFAAAAAAAGSYGRQREAYSCTQDEEAQAIGGPSYKRPKLRILGRPAYVMRSSRQRGKSTTIATRRVDTQPLPTSCASASKENVELHVMYHLI